MAQERCYRANHQYGKKWNPGEIRTIDKFDEEGRPAVSDHFRLVGRDEAVDEDKVFDKTEIEERKKESHQRDKRTAILEALDKLDPERDGDWTARGYPSMSALAAHLDIEVTRDEVTAASPDFDREKAYALKDAQGPS